MLFILESIDDTKKYLKDVHKINIDEEYEDIHQLKAKIFNSSLYKSAKENLSYDTLSKYRRYINKSGNNRKKFIKNAIISLGRAVQKKEDSIDPNIDDNKIVF
ncbi:MAG: hypothetical protein ABSG25_12270 [Bryobacteraceae bacterium]